MSERAAAEVLERAVSDGLAVERRGRISGFTLTAAGRVRHGELLRAASTDNERTVVDAAYRQFMALNRELLSLCTDWQRRASADVAHRLGAVDDSAQPIVARLAAAVPRFATYGPRLAAARQRFERGETEWLTKPLIDSYHTIWFELHEDLLCTLGMERSEEEQS